MNAIRNIAGAARKMVFRRSVRQQTRTLDPVVRTALAEDIGADETDLNTELQEIEVELEQAKKTLAEAEQKETFLGQRSRQYRVALDERVRQLRDEKKELREQEQQQRDCEGQENEEEHDVETYASLQQRAIDLEERLSKWERDEDALTSIIQTHKTILAECELMRRKIKELEQKREKCCSMATEVGDFLHAASSSSNIPNHRSDMDHHIMDNETNDSSTDDDAEDDDDIISSTQVSNNRNSSSKTKTLDTELQTLVPSGGENAIRRRDDNVNSNREIDDFATETTDGAPNSTRRSGEDEEECLVTSE